MRFRLMAVLAAVAFAPPLKAQTHMTDQPNLTFGGTGIPNQYVVTNTDSASLGILLGLTATARCSGSPQACGTVVTNDGTNKFFAAAGTINGLGSWNFDLALIGANIADDNYKLFADFNPAVGVASFGSVIVGPTPFQDSWNPDQGFLCTSIGGILIPSTSCPFDPNASGEYEYRLVAYDPGTANQTALDGIAYTDILVEVCGQGTTPEDHCSTPGTVTPEPATMSMLAMGLVGMAGAGLKRRRNKSA